MDESRLDEVVAEDRRLEAVADKAGRELMRHRWNWTLDESNNERLSMRAYATAIGRSYATVYRYAKGYVILLADDTHAVSPDEARERAGMSAEAEQATDAVAQARGVSFHVAREKHADEVRRVRDSARHEVESRGTAFAEAARETAQLRAGLERTLRREAEQRRKATFFQYLTMEAALDKLAAACADVRRATREAAGTPFTREQREFLVLRATKARRDLDALRAVVSGEAEPDTTDQGDRLVLEADEDGE